MLKFSFSKSLVRSLKDLHPHEKVAIQRQIDSFMLAMDTRQIPTGFGIKKLGGDLWEFRTDVALRILFKWSKSEIIFLFVGNHNEVSLYLKHYLS